ncbi:MAG: hypothetical protein PUD33_00895 [Treponema sp.]|nr:hypothetical protein [Treponema sp.]
MNLKKMSKCLFFFLVVSFCSQVFSQTVEDGASTVNTVNIEEKENPSSKKKTKTPAKKKSKKSSKNKKEALTENQENLENPQVLQNAENALNSEKEQEAEKKSSKKTKQKASSKTKKTSKNKGNPFSQKKINHTVGNIKLYLNGKLGTYNISVLDDKAISYNVLETYDECTSSFFSLLIGTKEYKLSDKTGISVAARSTESGGQLLYSVQKLANVIVDFTCIKSEAQKAEDIVQVTVSVQNITKRLEAYGIKAVLDTVLGERFSAHFYDKEKLINYELQVKNFDDLKSISSKNSKAAMEVLFACADASLPEVFSLANKDVFTLPGWIPSCGDGKPFDSVFSYNNSAVGLNWSSVKVNPEESFSVKFYIALSTDGRPSPGEEFVKLYEKKQEELKEAERLEQESKADDDVQSKNGAENNNVYKNIISSESESVKKVPKSSVQMEKKTQNSSLPEEKSLKPVSKSQLDPVYIQKLIDKIEKLDPNSTLERSEFLLLNDELDSIIEALEKENASR